jgi:hypothetical protein
VAGIAASRPDEPEHHEPEDARQDGRPAGQQDRRSRLAASSQRP